MSKDYEDTPPGDLPFTSSLEMDVWNGEKSGCEYEWWYFDALSDDASEALVIVFMDNFVFSPRYNSTWEINRADTNPQAEVQTFPAVAFTYYQNGKAVYRSLTEFNAKDFKATEGVPGCRIGDCSFEYKSAPYGNGYSIKIDLPVGRTKRIKARFEWLSIESNLIPGVQKEQSAKHVRNIVAPRSDVTGQITIVDSKNKREKRKFRGTGYHDHNSDSRWMPETIDEWFWGRAHFPFATAVFYHLKEKEKDPVSKFFLVKDGEIDVSDAKFTFGVRQRKEKLSLAFPESFSVEGNGVELKVIRPKVIDSSFFYLRTICDMTLSNDGHDYETAGIAEYLKPGQLKNRWLRRLIDLRIGRDGKRPVLS